MTSKESSGAEEIRKKIELATEAVSTISDPSLKAVAFEVVLQKLLASEGLPAPGPEPTTPSYAKVRLPAVTPPAAAPPAKRPRGPKGRVEELLAEGFFRQKRTLKEVKDGLAARAWFHPIQDLSPTMLILVKERKLRRIKEPITKGGKLVWRYSEW
jgi:hypothetical protein